MSDSVNRYRASWIAWPVRLLCWPLAVLYWIVGLLVRALGLPRAFFFERSDDDEQCGWRVARQNHSAFNTQAFEYVAFMSDVVPPMRGRVADRDQSLGPWMEAKRRLKKSHVAMISAGLFVLYLYVGVAAQTGWIADDYKDSRRDKAFAAPMTQEGLYFGTDFQGRNVLSLTFRGATTALWIGTFAAGLSCLVGMVLGALAGYFGGIVDDIIVWLYTTIASVPYLLLLLAFVYVFRANEGLKEWYEGTFFYDSWNISLGLFRIVVAIGLTSWVGICRVVRAEFIKLRESEYVAAGKALGYSNTRLMFRHIMPNVFHLVLVSFSLLFISAIKFEVILSFLGIGLEVGEASWGVMILQGAQELIRTPSVWWQITAATLAMFGLVLAVNLLSDTLRDALDPRLRT